MRKIHRNRTGDNYKKTMLSLDPLESNTDGIAQKNLVKWLLEG